MSATVFYPYKCVLFVKHIEEAVGGRPVGLEELDDERVLDVLRDGRLPPQI